MEGPGTTKIRFSYGRVAFFEDFGRCKIRPFFGVILGGSGGGFWEGFGRCWVDFRVFKTSQIFESKLKPEKVVLETRKGVREVGVVVLN